MTTKAATLKTDIVYVSMDKESIKKSIHYHLRYTLAKDDHTVSANDVYSSLAYTVRDRLIERWLNTQRNYYQKQAKRVYYLSLEFLIGRTLKNSLINLGLYDACNEAVQEMGYSLDELEELEHDAGLGNGGLGRLAACFLDSMATIGLPAYGYGIRYEYGIFEQTIRDGYQHEVPDNWLQNGNHWEFERPSPIFPVKFYGHVHQYIDESGDLRSNWIENQLVMAVPHDMPIPGYHNNTVNNLRLWAARSSKEFDLNYFNYGNYVKAVEDKNLTENISKVLYPNDNISQGRELRLKQQYFFVSATLQDIIRRYKKKEKFFDNFTQKVAIQLNDTHPAIAIPELMRILIDEEKLGWEEAWDVTVKTFSYTNHTVLPEALEKWSVQRLGTLLPRHLQIIEEINRRFLNHVESRFPNDPERYRRMSIFEEGEEKRIRMAHLAIVGSHTVNGVAALHTEILINDVFKDFHELYPNRFQNKTNGITQRRWLKMSNPLLSELISDTIGDGWVRNLNELEKLIPYAEDKAFREVWQEIKKKNKERFIRHVQEKELLRSPINPDSLFDFQVKRLHEYKRQLLNVLHVITLYNRIKENPSLNIPPRTVLFSGKAAPGYKMAKLIIKLINSVADVINRDSSTNHLLHLSFLPNYSVSLAEKIFPAADLSEQISTAGMEASGTGNMKFALNGSLTIGTLDGANVEIKEEVGGDNIFIFGLKDNEVADLKRSGYRPRDYYEQNPELKRVLDMIAGDYFSTSNPMLFQPIIDSLLGDDRFMLLADYAAYIACQERVNEAYFNQDEWTRRAILNVAKMGKFSSDRTINEYAGDIWNIRPVEIDVINPENLKD